MTGGAERQAARLAACLARRGAGVRILTGRQDPRWAPHAERDGYVVTRLSAPALRCVGSLVFMLKVVWFLIRRASRCDLIHVFMLKHEALAALIAARLMRKPIVLRPSGASTIGDVGWALAHPLRRLLLHALRRADAFIALSTDIASELASAGFPRSKIRVIPNGVPVPAEAATGNPRRVVFLGRLAPEKNLPVLLDAWRTVTREESGAELVVFGEGPERERLERLAADYGLGASVRFAGFVEDTWTALSEAGVFVLPSASEGMSAALVEAMAAGLAVVATDVSGSRDVIASGRNGFLVRPGDKAELAEKILVLLKDDSLRRKLARAARDYALENLDENVVTDSHLELYASLLGRRLRAGRRKIRVAHVIATLDAGGSERQMAKLVALLDRDKFEPQVVCLTRLGPTKTILDAAGVETRLVAKRSKFDLGAFARLCAMLRRFRPDVVHTWLFTSNAYGRAAALVARAPRTFASERSTDPWKGIGHRAVDRVLAIFTEKIFVNCEAVRDALVKRKIPQSRIALCPNMVESPRRAVGGREPEALRASLGVPAGAPVVGYVGRLSREKGVARLIDAHEIVRGAFPEAVLLVVGEGELREELEEKAARVGGVVFAGRREDLRAFYALFDVLALLSDYEGSPNSVLEALAAGTPAVAAEVGGVAELARDSGGVVAVAPADTRAAAEAVVALLRDAERRHRMGERGSRYVAESHAPEKVARMIERYYVRQKG